VKGFSGLGVACWPLVPKFAGSNPAEAVGFLGRKNPQHTFLAPIFNHDIRVNGFGGLGVACWPLVPKFAGSNLAEAVRFLGRKNPQHAFLRRGSKAVGPMS